MIELTPYNEQLFFAILSLFILAGYGWIVCKS